MFGCLGPSNNGQNKIITNASNALNNSNVSVNITGNVNQRNNVPVVIQSFVADPVIIKKGEASILRWDVSGANNVILEGIGDVSLQGSMAVMPNKTTTYTLTAVGKTENKTATVQIMVKEENKSTESSNVPIKEESVCGDDVCSSDENSTSCCTDCGCEEGYYCEENECVPNETSSTGNGSSSMGSSSNSSNPVYYNPELNVHLNDIPSTFCGDGVCSGAETTSNCCADCGCDNPSDTCENNTCISAPSLNLNLITTINGGFTNLGLLGGGSAPKETFTANTNHISTIEFEKDSSNLKISLVFKSTDKMSDMVKSNTGPKIYFDTNFDGKADFVATIYKSNVYVWSSAESKNVYTGTTTCGGAMCSVELPWNTIFGTHNAVDLWLSNAKTNERAPRANALRLNWNSFNLTRSHTNEDAYIVMTIDKIKVYNDQDKYGEGEIMFAGAAKSGNVTTKFGFPTRIWYELNSGDTIMALHDEGLPLFAAKESQMGNDFYFTFAAYDNDDLPGLLRAFIDIFTGKAIANGFSRIIPGMKYAQKLNVLGNVVHSIADLAGRADYVGSAYNIYNKSQNYGIGTHKQRRGDLEVTYTIKRVWVPRNLHANVRVYGIKIIDSSDSNWHCCSRGLTTGGEFYSYLRVGIAFNSDGTLNQSLIRYPEHGTTCVCNGWVKCPAYDKHKFGQRPEYKQLYDGKVIGPFLYIEIDNWDEDNPAIGDDDDPLGIWDYMYVLDESFFDWKLDSNVPLKKTINSMRIKHGVSGGTSQVDLGTVIWQE